MPATPPSRRTTLLPTRTAAAGAALLAVGFLLVAWISDDAQISFRTIENLLVGRAEAPTALELMVDGGDRHVLTFRLGDEGVGQREEESPTAAFQGMAAITVPSPQRPFDRVRLRVTLGADGVAASGGLRLR